VKRRSLIAVALALLLSSRAVGEPPPLAVVVGRDSVITRMSVDQLRDIYLRRQRILPNGQRVIPINLPPSNPARDRFSRAVLGRPSQDLMAYWNDRYFEGITPPLVLPSATAIIAYLANEPAAIAYLPLSQVTEDARVLLVLSEAPSAPDASGR